MRVVDVCLILEGTYPRVTGGVSQWVQSLLELLGDLTFSVVHLGASAPSAPARYAAPPNLLAIEDVILDVELPARPVHADTGVPDAAVYHALSTGFAGLVGARVAAARNRPLVLTEHGIYSHEARLGCKRATAGRAGGNRIAVARRLEGHAREAYARAVAIRTVCAANASVQRSLGAPACKLGVIPNAVSPPVGQPREPTRGSLREPCVGFVGRVVPIKDVGTFLRACRLIADELPRASFAVVGPLTHTPDYAAACRELAGRLDLEERLVFTGETDPAPWYRRLDVLVLTSLSEAQPLVVLEAMAAGIPIVSSAVGGLPELLGGGAPAGLLVPVRDPGRTAAAVLRLCLDGALRHGMGASGRRRARGLHGPERLGSAYRMIYDAAATGAL